MQLIRLPKKLAWIYRYVFCRVLGQLTVELTLVFTAHLGLDAPAVIAQGYSWCLEYSQDR